MFLVAHDWGAIIAWNFCLFVPERVKALVNLSVPYRSRNPIYKPLQALRAIYGDDYYICRFQVFNLLPPLLLSSCVYLVLARKCFFGMVWYVLYEGCHCEQSRCRSTCLLQKPGAAEADFASTDTAENLKFILSYNTPEPLIMPKGKLFDPSIQPVSLPSWLSEEDINYYTGKFKKTGFTGGFNYYRCLDL